MNVFFARDPSRWRPTCVIPHVGSFTLKEIEDLFVVGTPNQIQYCSGTACKDAEAPGISCGGEKACSYATMPLTVYRASGPESSVCFCK
jgi:hypothetical protein